MMQVNNHIEVKIKTVNGYLPFCIYQVGSNLEQAERIFATLAGVPENESKHLPFQLDLIERKAGHSVVLASQYCSIVDLRENCHYIAKEVFKLFYLEG